MKDKKKRRKTIAKWIFVIIVLFMLVYVFKDLAGPVLWQLKNTSLTVIVLILISTLLYGVSESFIFYIFVRQYINTFSFGQSFEMSYFLSFYRTISLGSGTTVAAAVYLNKCGMSPSEAAGMHLIEYSLHKLSIGIMAVVLFLSHYSYMKENYSSYAPYMTAGFAVTVVITAFLLLFVCSKHFHTLLKKLLDKCNYKGKFTEKFEKVKEQCDIMETASVKLLHNVKLIVSVILINFIKLSFWFIIPYIILYTTGSLTPGLSITITSVAVMLAAVIPIPAGIGSSEFVLTAMFSNFAESAEAGAVALLYRFATFVFPCLLGAVFAVKYALTKKKQPE